MTKRKALGEGMSPSASPSLASDESVLKVVAIGASAGGLDALEKLFDALPSHSGAAYVVIQHLSPDHKSMMGSLLARHTAMPVDVVEDSMALEPDRVYLIPPGAIMHLEGKRLRLTPKGPRSFVLPIDVFFQSLARHHGPHSVGVILSGTGSDGTRGAMAINEAGGFLLVQDPNEARFDGMPRSAIATGLVDDILPVEQMGRRILAHLSVFPGQRIGPEDTAIETPPRTPESAFTGILHLLNQLGKINFEDYKPGTVLRRIERRMAVRQIMSIQSYLELLSQDRAEALTLLHEMLIPVTSFFRDTEAYASVATQVVDALVSARADGQAIRVWCAGCSTGEEPYSIAMLFMEAFDQIKRWPSLKIFATDVDKTNIEVAAAGSYPESIAAEVTPARLERFFVRHGNRFVVRPELRQNIVFAPHNLLTDPPFTKMDLVVCRNTLIYFRNAAQQKALRRLQYALVPKGYLFLGSSESLGESQNDFQVINARQKIWQLLQQTNASFDIQPVHLGPVRRHGAGEATESLTRARRMSKSAVELGYGALLKRFGPPPAMLLNASQEVVHAFGDLSPYLRIREGQLSLDYNRILVEPLVPVAAALLFKSAREATGVTSDLVRLHTDESAGQAPSYVRLTALPAADVDGQKFSLLVIEKVGLHEAAPVGVMLDLGTETSERIRALEHELTVTRESLQATIEELETSNEELQATNEEMMASNEELQSANEELQSVNEELNTVNAEYQEKIDILNRTNAELDNLTRVVASSTVFVDEALKLVRFSPEAASIFRLRDSDLGRPLEDLNHQLEYPDLMDDLRQTLQSGVMMQKEVVDRQRRHFMVRILPYHIASSEQRVVVINFHEVTDLMRLQSVVDMLDEQVAMLDEQGTVLLVNQAWSRLARSQADPSLVSGEVGSNYLDACRAAGELNLHAQAVYGGLQALLARQQDRFVIEYPCDASTEPRWFVMRASRMPEPLPGFLISHANITRWHGGQTVSALS